jgi:hypothetical protein
MAIVVTVVGCVQVGVNEFQDRRESRVFGENRTIADILSWASITLGKDHVDICELIFSSYTGSSM